MSALPCIVLRCDASSEMGMGHLVRCEALAAALCAHRPCAIHFAIRGSEAAALRAERGGWQTLRLPLEPAVAAGALTSHVAQLAADAVVFDVREPVPDWSVDALRERPIVLALIDDESPMRLAMDLIFSPPMPQTMQLDGSSLRGSHYIGWEWVPLRASFVNAAKLEPAPPSLSSPLLVCMGGADPAGLTLKALRALERIETLPTITVVIGELYAHEPELRALCERSRHRVHLRKDVADMAGLMRLHGVALSSFGVIAYELAVVGLPALYLSLTRDHALCAAELERQGAARHLGLADEVSEAQIAHALVELHGALEARGAMAQRGRRLIDGCGARRIAAAVLEAVEKRDG